MCARAIYETVACFRDFVARILPLLDANDVDKLDNYLRTRIFATRLPSLLAHDSSVSAPNILSQIDKLTKEQPRAREAYDHLSEIVHPNALVRWSTLVNCLLTVLCLFLLLPLEEAVLVILSSEQHA
jgi:hypothetical protein